MGDLIEALLEPLYQLVKLPRKVFRTARRIGERPKPAQGVGGVLDLALAGRRRPNSRQRPRGGVLRSGDVEIVVERHLQISLENVTLIRLEVELISSLVFRRDHGTTALFALSSYRPPQRLLGAAEISAAEWALLSDLIAEVTYGRLSLPPSPVGGC